MYSHMYLYLHVFPSCPASPSCPAKRPCLTLQPCPAPPRRPALQPAVPHLVVCAAVYLDVVQVPRGAQAAVVMPHVQLGQLTQVHHLELEAVSLALEKGGAGKGEAWGMDWGGGEGGELRVTEGMSMLTPPTHMGPSVLN